MFDDSLPASSEDYTNPFRLAEAAALEIQVATGGGPHDVAVVLGSGWTAAAERIGEADTTIPTSRVSGFPVPTVPGHGGLIRSQWVDRHRVLVLAGRVHLYEGHETHRVVHGVRTAVLCGCKVVILTNAAGSLNPDLGVGRGVLISDHINLTGRSATWGPEPPEPYASRFVDLTDAYSPRLRALAREVAPELGEGVYAALGGPNYETPAEIRMLRTLGADLVGMSTALETIASRHLGAEVLGISLVTNLAAGVSEKPLDHTEVLAAGAAAAAQLGETIRQVIARL